MVEKNNNIHKQKFFGIICLSTFNETTESIKYYRYVENDGKNTLELKSLKMPIEEQRSIKASFNNAVGNNEFDTKNIFLFILINRETNHYIKTKRDYLIPNPLKYENQIKKAGGEIFPKSIFFYLPQEPTKFFFETPSNIEKIDKRLIVENEFNKNNNLQVNENFKENVDLSQILLKNNEKELSKFEKKRNSLQSEIKKLEERKQEIVNSMVKEIEDKKIKRTKSISRDIYKLTQEKNKLEKELEEIKLNKETVEKEKINLDEEKKELEKEKAELKEVIEKLKITKEKIENGKVEKINSVQRVDPKEEIIKSLKNMNNGGYELLNELNKKITDDNLKITKTIAYFKELLENEKTNYPKDELIFLYSSTIVTNRLCILMGNPGYGKSSLVREFVRIFNKTTYGTENLANICFLPVSPEWIDPTYILGSFNYLTSEPEITDFVKTIYLAEKLPKIDFFIIFDEFNIARPESYFAPFLSLLELPDDDDNRKIKIWSKNITNDNKDFYIRLNGNIHLLATINEDSTTFELSPKVKDRSDILILHPTKERINQFINDLKINPKIKKVVLDLNNRWYKNNASPLFSYRKLNSLSLLKDEVSIDYLLAYRLFNNLPYQIEPKNFESFLEDFKKDYKDYPITIKILSDHLNKIIL